MNIEIELKTFTKELEQLKRDISHTCDVNHGSFYSDNLARLYLDIVGLKSWFAGTKYQKPFQKCADLIDGAVNDSTSVSDGSLAPTEHAVERAKQSVSELMSL